MISFYLYHQLHLLFDSHSSSYNLLRILPLFLWICSLLNLIVSFSNLILFSFFSKRIPKCYYLTQWGNETPMKNIANLINTYKNIHFTYRFFNSINNSFRWFNSSCIGSMSLVVNDIFFSKKRTATDYWNLVC